MVEQGFCRQHHAGRAETALQAADIHECLLYGMKRLAFSQTLNSRYLFAACFYGQHKTCVYRLTFDEHRAGPTLSLAAAFLGPRETQVFP